jgi:hypothetical protein
VLTIFSYALNIVFQLQVFLQHFFKSLFHCINEIPFSQLPPAGARRSSLCRFLASPALLQGYQQSARALDRSVRAVKDSEGSNACVQIRLPADRFSGIAPQRPALWQPSRNHRQARRRIPLGLALGDVDGSWPAMAPHRAAMSSAATLTSKAAAPACSDVACHKEKQYVRIKIVLTPRNSLYLPLPTTP